jgi:hypothetical protein
VNVVATQPAPPALPFEQLLAAPVAGLPVFMNSGGSVKGLSTIYIAS